jgi:hypothetical protein
MYLGHGKTRYLVLVIFVLLTKIYELLPSNIFTISFFRGLAVPGFFADFRPQPTNRRPK